MLKTSSPASSLQVCEPYRILFPLGVLGAWLGVSLWLLFSSQKLEFYPRESHAFLMYFSFLWSFVAGFLMTAIPKMTGTSSAHLLEILAAVVLVLLQMILTLQGRTSTSIFLYGLQTLFLVVFVLRRFLVFRRIPFAGFLFLPAAFVSSFLGVALFAFGFEVSLSSVFLLCGEAFLMNLIFGLGGRLIPVISRLPKALLPHESAGQENWAGPVFVCLLLNAGYGFELFYSVEMGLTIRAVTLLVGAVFLWGLFRRPSSWTLIGVGLKLSVLFLVLGQILGHPLFSWGLAGTHLMLIGGFCLLTMLISTRVTLAHGGQDLAYEVQSKMLFLLILLLLGAAILRFLAQNHVMGWLNTVAVLVFLVALLLWLIKFVLVLRQLRSHENC